MLFETAPMPLVREVHRTTSSSFLCTHHLTEYFFSHGLSHNSHSHLMSNKTE